MVIVDGAKAGFLNPDALLKNLHFVANSRFDSARGDGSVVQDAASISSVESLLAIVGPDTSTLLFNISSLYFYKHRYYECRQILEALFLHIEPVGEGLSLKICFLLLEVMLSLTKGVCSSDVDATFEMQAKNVLKFIEKYVVSKDEDLAEKCDNSTEQPGAAKNESLTFLINGRTKQQLFRDFIALKMQIYRSRIFIYLKQLKFAKKEIKSAIEFFHKELRLLFDVEHTSVQWQELVLYFNQNSFSLTTNNNRVVVELLDLYHNTVYLKVILCPCVIHFCVIRPWYAIKANDDTSVSYVYTMFHYFYGFPLVTTVLE